MVILIRNSDSGNEEARNQTDIALKKMRDTKFPEKLLDQVLLGFEGNIDNVFSVIRVRKSPFEYEIMEKISEWAERIARSAGSSASIERVVKKISVGGFTSNVGRALSTLCGRIQNVHLIGAFGLPKIKEIFQEQLTEIYQCVLLSVGNPGLTDAYEFTDGKIMMVHFAGINEPDWNQIISQIGEDQLIEEFDSSRLWGIGYWASNPKMSQIFIELQDRIFPSLSHSAKNKYIILDLADLRKKPRSQLKELATLLPRFEDHVQVVLLLNDLELIDLGTFIAEKASTDPLNLTESIQKKLNLSFVISHGPKVATIATENLQNIILNAYTSSPQFTTAAGDHFDAGVAYALLLDLPAEVLPLIGNCTTSFFVRKGVSPTPQDLQQFLSNYLKNIENG
ncbi:MAG: hypothetical protein HWN65_14230 [Candidatus Helarchaeota archaeon]|nr:hypothetical protein [Candidatus Helarchaeota archaeon]